MLATSFVGALDVSVMAVAGPSIQRGLGSSPAQVQWVVSGYALMFGLSLIPFGRLGDAMGRRRVFLLALAGFVVSSAAAGVAPSPAVLIVARLAQGLCAGAMAPQSAAMIVELFPAEERGRAFGISAAVGSIAMGLGPLAGGTILTAVGEPDGWRWIMFINVPIGVIVSRVLGRSISSALSCSVAQCWRCCCRWAKPALAVSATCGGCSWSPGQPARCSWCGSVESSLPAENRSSTPDC
jgi:MFS family permease